MIGTTQLIRVSPRILSLRSSISSGASLTGARVRSLRAGARLKRDVCDRGLDARCRHAAETAVKYIREHISVSYKQTNTVHSRSHLNKQHAKSKDMSWRADRQTNFMVQAGTRKHACMHAHANCPQAVYRHSQVIDRSHRNVALLLHRSTVASAYPMQQLSAGTRLPAFHCNARSHGSCDFASVYKDVC